MRVTNPISISLTNTRRLNAAQSALFTPDSDYETPRASDIYLITEPWWRTDDDPDVPHFSVKEPSGLYPILPAQVIAADARPRVFAYASTLRRDFEVFNRYDLAQDLDFLILEIRQGSHPPFLLVDLYNQDPPDDAQEIGRTFARFMRVQLPDMPIAIASFLDSYHHLVRVSLTPGTPCRLHTALLAPRGPQGTTRTPVGGLKIAQLLPVGLELLQLHHHLHCLIRTACQL